MISLNPADLLPSDNGTTATFLIQNSHLKSTITQNNSPVDGTLTEVQNDNSYYWVDGTIYPVITGYFNFTNDGTVPSIAGTNFDSNPIPYDHDGNPIYF